MRRSRGGIEGGLFGLLVFLVGIGLLLFTFKLAFELFNTPPQQTLGLAKDKAMDVNLTGANAAGVLFRTLAMAVMALVGALIATRGVALYSGSITPKTPKDG
jgi:hypothetical protein